VRAIGVVRVRPPPVPLTVTVEAPSVAVADAVSVSVTDAPVVDVGLNAALTPVGSPVALNATLAANPFTRAMAIVLVPDALRAIERDAGDADSEKSGVAGAVTVSAIGVVRVRPPPVPVTVTGEEPSVAVDEAVSVSVTEAPVVDVGLNAAVTPAGRPVALKATALANPPVRVIVIVLVPDAPRAIESAAGAADSEKSGCVAPASP